MLPFRRLPRLLLVHLLRNTEFWKNAFPYDNSAFPDYSPRYLLQGNDITFKHHVRLEFGSYVQTHEDHDNTMNARTTGAICMGPTGNRQGGHYFFNLSTGEPIVRHRWTVLPMPQDVIDRLSTLGAAQRMPLTLTFADHHGCLIPDPLDNLDAADFPPDDDSNSAYQTDSSSDDEDDNDLLLRLIKIMESANEKVCVQDETL